ncbi:MAG: hypothetical protein R3E95_13190 [Thiolinea sp.]
MNGPITGCRLISMSVVLSMRFCIYCTRAFPQTDARYGSLVSERSKLATPQKVWVLAFPVKIRRRRGGTESLTAWLLIVRDFDSLGGFPGINANERFRDVLFNANAKYSRCQNNGVIRTDDQMQSKFFLRPFRCLPPVIRKRRTVVEKRKLRRFIKRLWKQVYDHVSSGVVDLSAISFRGLERVTAGVATQIAPEPAKSDG